MQRIKALAEAKADETDPARLAAINAKIAELNAIKADGEKKAGKAA